MDYGNQQQAGTRIGGAGLVSPSTERVLAVPDAFVYQEARLQDLDAVVEKLFNRLSPILRPSSPADARNEKPDSHPVALAGAIYRNSLRLESNCRALTDLLDRLEI